ncbi:MAG: hypothetical protein EOP04_09065 [Proteobacteria bacterium]|nr:MAG: hypothetical protein EOP04_09065 [Pseudomonadota bacterium]
MDKYQVKSKHWIYALVVIFAWSWLAGILSEKFFPGDRAAEITFVICFLSIGLFLAFATEYLTLKLRTLRTETPDRKF